jgi:hypothetical protein
MRCHYWQLIAIKLLLINYDVPSVCIGFYKLPYLIKFALNKIVHRHQHHDKIVGNILDEYFGMRKLRR